MSPSAWAPWFADGEGTIKTLLPRSNTLGGQFKGTADAVYQYLDMLQAHSPDLVAVFAADHVYRMDVRQMVAFHRERRADVTVAGGRRAAGPGVALRRPRRPRRTAGSASSARSRSAPPAMPSDPTRAYASMGNYLFDPEVLEEALLDARRRGDTDFGRDVLPRALLEPPRLRLRFRREPGPRPAGPRGARPTGATSAR